MTGQSVQSFLSGFACSICIALSLYYVLLICRTIPRLKFILHMKKCAAVRVCDYSSGDSTKLFT